MKNHNYREMSTKELKAYVLEHRNDNEAFDEYRSRLRPVGPSYTFLNKTETERQQLQEVIRRKIQDFEQVSGSQIEGGDDLPA